MTPYDEKYEKYSTIFFGKEPDPQRSAKLPPILVLVFGYFISSYNKCNLFFDATGSIIDGTRRRF